jgi:hypothetical protein
LTLQEFLDKYGDEMGGVLLRGIGVEIAARLVNGPKDEELDAIIGRAYKRRDARVESLLRRIYTDLTGEANEQPKTLERQPDIRPDSRGSGSTKPGPATNGKPAEFTRQAKAADTPK